MTEAALPPLDNDRNDRAAPRVAYVMTHYPNPSQTFLLREVVALDGDGLSIERISINRLEADALQTDEERREARATFHVKALRPVVVVMGIVALAARRPGGFVRALIGALRPVATDPRLALRRVFHFAEAILVWNHCRDRGVEHIHAQFGGLPATVAMLAASLAAHVDRRVVSWSFTIHGFHDFVEERELGLAEKAASASFVLCVSDQLRSQLMRVADTSHWPRIHVVRCGIDVDRLAPRATLPLSSPPVVLTVGRLGREKGHATLLEAAALLAKRGRPVRLRFIGDGPERSRLEAISIELGLAEGVEMLGSCTPAEVQAALKQADLFCLPSFAEGIPVAIMEAMAVGVPVVSTLCGGIPELVRDGVSGKTVTPGRPDQLADGIEALLDDEPLRRAVVATGRQMVLDLHDLDRNVQMVKAHVLEAITATREAPRSEPA